MLLWVHLSHHNCCGISAAQPAAPQCSSETEPHPLGKVKEEKKNKTGTFTPWRLPFIAQLVKNLPAMQETWVQSLGLEDPPGIDISRGRSGGLVFPSLSEFSSVL